MTVSPVLVRAVALAAGLATLLAACGGSPSADPSPAASTTPAASTPSTQSSPAARAAASTFAGTAGAGGSAAGGASTRGGSASAASASAPAAGASVGNGPATAGAVRLAIAPDANSQVDIKMRELLAGNVAQNDAIESTKTVSGTIGLDASGAVLPGSKISLDLRTLKSDRSQRDNFIKGRFVLDTAQFPLVEFVPTDVQGLGGTPPTSGQKTFKLIGNTTIRGVTRPLTWDVTASFDQQGCQGQATTAFRLSDFGMSPPKAGPVVQVEDAGALTMKFQATRS